MQLELFRIIFENADGNTLPVPVYRAGETVTVRVHIKLREPIKCRDIVVHCRGGSVVDWVNNCVTDTPAQSSMSSESYIDRLIGIYSPQAEGPFAGHHPAGEFFYPVSFPIPETAPSSFLNSAGAIRYCVEARINRPQKESPTVKRTYTVTGNLDLNNEPQVLVGPYSISDTMILDFWTNIMPILCCCCGHVGVRLSLAKRGFVPGEEVHVTGQLINRTPVDLRNCSLAICQRASFYAAKDSYNSCGIEVASVTLPPIPKGRSLQLSHLLPLGSVSLSHLRGCGNIDVRYYLELHVKGSCLSAGSMEFCELLIGSVPLHSSPTELKPAGQEQYQ